MATASISARSWLMRTSVPSYASSASSRASRPSASRWFVGSSRINRLPPVATSSARLRRRRSPPERSATRRSAASPGNRNTPSSVRACVRVRPVSASTDSATVRSPRSSSPCCEKYVGSTRCPRLTRPAAAGRLPSSVSTSVVLPAPFGPTRATRWPRSIVRLTSATSVVSPTATRTPSASSTTRPVRTGVGNPNSSALPLRCTSTRFILSSCFWRDAACLAFVPARHRSTNRCSRSISASTRAANAACSSSAFAFSTRNAEYPMGHSFERPCSSSRTPVATDSRNHRSWDTTTRAQFISTTACSSHSADCTSRWLVGSSSSSTSGRPASARASEARVSSPPLNTDSGSPWRSSGIPSPRVTRPSQVRHSYPPAASSTACARV